MVEEPLVDEGKLLLEHFAETGLRCRAAFWFRAEESREWSLVLVIPEVDTEGPLTVYGKIESLLKKHRGQFKKLDLLDIRAVDLGDPLADLAEKVKLRISRAPREFHTDLLHASTGGTMVTYSS